MKNSIKIKRMMGLSIIGSIVAALSLIKIPLGQFSITLALIPLVVGSILYGPKGGIFLGFIMGLVVLLMDAQFFYALNPIGTIIVVLLKSILTGLIVGLVYNLIKNKNKKLAIIIATLIAPIINTSVFFIGCLVFFYKPILGFATDAGVNAIMYIIVYYIGINFIIEFFINIVLSPTVVYLINVVSKNYNIGISE